MKPQPELLAFWASQGLRNPPLINRVQNSLLLNIAADNLALYGNIKWDDGRPTIGHRNATAIIRQRLIKWLAERHAFPGQTVYLWGEASRWQVMSIPHMLTLYDVVHVNEQNRLYALGAPILFSEVAAVVA
jgi:hypothetical protein